MARASRLLFVLASSTVSCALLADVGDLPYPDAGGPDVRAPDASDAAPDAHAPDAHADVSAPDTGPPDARVPACVHRDTQTAFIDPGGAGSIVVSAPQNAPGDLMLAVLDLGFSSNTKVPGFTPPPGWILVDQKDHAPTMSLLVYRKFAGASEPTSYEFTADAGIAGVGWISTYASVDPVQPVDVNDARDWPDGGSSFAAPSITTTGANELVVVSFGGFGAWGDAGAVWTKSPGTLERANVENGGSRCGLGEESIQTAPGTTPTFTATTRVRMDYALTHALALRCQ